MKRFEEGDEVKIISTDLESQKQWLGHTGVVWEVNEDDQYADILIYRNGISTHQFNFDELENLEPAG